MITAMIDFIMSSNSSPLVNEFPSRDLEDRLNDFAILLHDCVHAGASVGFVFPFSLADAAAYWRTKVLPDLQNNALKLIVANDRERIVGAVQLYLDMFSNQPHRAEVRKLLVHPQMRRRGIGRTLMLALEGMARRMDRTLLTLDTRSGDLAEPLYIGLNYQIAGIIPDYCRDPFLNRLDSTTVMYKILS